MIEILFLRNENVYLPEIDAYIKYFNNTQIFKAYDSAVLKNKINIEEFDVVWEFKGIGGKKVKNQILVHEYASLSIGKYPKVKNFLKARINPKPDLRVFLNEKVKLDFSLNDDIDYCYRDMGIDEKFLHVENVNKEYDFVYVGSISKEREIDKLLEVFTQKSNGKLCLVGKADDDIFNKYKNHKDLIFTGKVPYSEVPRIASKARYGINYIPDKYPFNIQTSTKLLEYLALGLKVVTTNYNWVRNFEKDHDCSFYKLDYTNLTFDKNNIEKHNFVSNFKAEDYLWEKVIEQSNIEKILLEKCNP